MSTLSLSLTTVLAPLCGSLIAGLAGKQVGRQGAAFVTIGGVAIAFLCSLFLFYNQLDAPAFNANLYTWATVGDLNFSVGFLIDRLTTVMMIVVTFVSLMVHVYTVGYMHEDPGYQRFFSYISLFTFSMLMLVMSNNFMQLFFGWEAVGLVSYLLIGFWYKKETAIFANMKAFLVNRVGDFGFILGIGFVLYYFGSLDYATVFGKVSAVVETNPTIEIFDGEAWSVMTVMCILLFIGAMGKSAQVPLHVWLPDSMEGPTPISALIHAATMVTAGIFMVSRMSPLFETSEAALSFILGIGATTALFMGLLGLVQNDIKRVVAYSTLSQLGYMVVALGVSAYSAAIFHLMTHAFFKALLFLGAGSVIIGMHHIQDIEKMGNIKKYMPITWITSLIGSVALIGFPGTAGFYSKDAIIEAVKSSNIPMSDYAFFCVMAGVFITALYSFRMYFLVFHTNERMDEKTKSHLHESPAVVWGPLVALAIPSICIGWFTIEPMLFGDYFKGVISVGLGHNNLEELSHHYHGAFSFAIHGFLTKPFWLAMAGVATAYLFFVFKPQLAVQAKSLLSVVRLPLVAKYWFDDINQTVFAKGSVLIGKGLWKGGDVTVIDNIIINGSADRIGKIAKAVRQIQSGYVHHYAFAIVVGLTAALVWLLLQR